MVTDKLQKKVKRIVRKMFEEMLEDEYLSHLFPTFLNIIDVEQTIVNIFSEKLLPAVKERNTCKLQKIAIKVAKRHKELNIPIYEFHKYFNLFCESLKNFLSSKESCQILTFQDLEFFKETFLKYYALGYMDCTIEAGKNLITYLKNYFNSPFVIKILDDFHSLIKNLEQNKNLSDKEKMEILTEFLFFNEKKYTFLVYKIS
jgi:truncated hemoglobin YjbI